MSTKHLKHGGSILLGIGWILLCFIFAFSWGSFYTGTKAQHATQNDTRSVVSPRVFRKPLSTSQETLSDFQKTEFYRTIIDNNLFRPLGWRPSRPREPYRLLGTVLSRDEDTPKQAIVQRTTTGSTETVTIGETLDNDTSVVDIASKQVTLETGGRQRTLKLH